MILSFSDVSFRYAVDPILDQVSFVVNEKDKWGVVGLNGCGKSTFLRLCAGLEQPNEGTITLLNRYRISYCPQESSFDDRQTVYQTVEAHLAKPVEPYRIRSILSKLGFDDPETSVSVCSGGQKKRIALAIALIEEADLYLLDEPTNHLDQSMILWLEKYLAKVSKALILVTHDRYFLSRITDHIVELDQGKLYCYQGNYADYLEQKELRYQQLLNAEAKRQNFLRKEIEWIRAGAQARSTKSKSRIERYNAIAAQAAPVLHESLQMASAARRLGGKIIEMTNLSKSYNNQPLFAPFSYKVLRDDRLAIIGDNGAGKSTLLKMIVGQVVPDEGELVLGETVQIGYFAQHNEVFSDQQRVIDYLKDFGEVVYSADGQAISASDMLERFLFHKEDQYQPVQRLSGGEKRRLYLCSILMQAPNVLLLDEPTNDLDTETLGILEDYLEQFQGAVICVSHDRYFVDKVCDHLLIIDQKKVSFSNQCYSEYLENRSPLAKEGAEPAAAAKANTHRDTNRLSYKEKLELEKIEKEMPFWEQRISELEESLSSLRDFAQLQSAGRELEEKRSEYEAMLQRWMELSERN